MSDTVIETHQHNGYTVEIRYDMYGGSDSPRDMESNIGLFLGFPHRRYTIGDETFDPRSYEITCATCTGTGVRDGVDCTTCEANGAYAPTSEAELMEALRIEHGARVIRKVGMIDHSGVSYYLGGGAHSCDPGGWDSGTCGFIMDRPDRLKDLGCEDFTDEKIVENLEIEVKEYGAWSNGEVYTVTVLDQNGDVVESCGGFIGDYVFQQSTWSDLVPSDPPPATLHRLRFTDHTLDVIEQALSGAGPVEYANVLGIVREARGKKRDEEDE